MGIDVERVYALSFGIGMACLGAAACFLLPAYYVNPQVGGGFVLVAFTIVVLGGMGSFAGALAGGLLIGVVESLGGLFLGDSLGQMGIFAIFILVLLFRPQGLFGESMNTSVKDACAILAFGLAVLAITGFTQSGVLLTFIMMSLYAALLSQAWNILGGYGGQLSSAMRCSSAWAPMPRRWASCRWAGIPGLPCPVRSRWAWRRGWPWAG